MSFDIQKIKDFWDDHCPSWVYRVKRTIRDRYYRVKYFWQRGKRGYSDLDWYDIDLWFIRTMPRLLREILEKGNSYPEGFGDVQTIEDWRGILREMIYYLENMNEDKVSAELAIEETDIIEIAKRTEEIIEFNKEHFFILFGKYFWCLWD